MIIMMVNRGQNVSFVSSSTELTSSRCFTGSTGAVLFRRFISGLLRLLVSRDRREIFRNFVLGFILLLHNYKDLFHFYSLSAFHSYDLYRIHRSRHSLHITGIN